MRRRRGSVLIAVLVLLGILVIMLAALHGYESQNRQGLERAEAVLNGRVALRWWEASWMDPSIRPPVPRGGVALSGSENEDLKKAAYALDQPWASSIFEREKLPDFAASPAEGLQSGQRLARVEVRAGRSLGAMRLTSSTRFDYAACAPQGEVRIGRLRSWANPVWSKGESGEAQGGGVPARVYAGRQVVMDRLDYGEVEMAGAQPPQVKQGQFLARTGVPAPLAANGAPLERELGRQCQAAFQQLSVRNLQDGDKSARIFNQLSLGDLLEYTTGLREWKPFEQNLLSLASANQFPFYTWCTVRVGVQLKPPRLTGMSLRVHSALIPDCPVLDDFPPPKNSDPSDEQQAVLKTLLPELAPRLLNLPAAQLSQPPPVAPATWNPSEGKVRGDEKYLHIGWNGQSGTVYLGWLNQIPKLVEAVGLVLQIPPKIGDACLAMGRTARVYWFGNERFESKFQITPGSQPKLAARCTLTVPRGRSFYMKGDLSLEGDLWIQRGASFQVDGDLTTLDAHVKMGDWPFLSHGRIVLEQGASLVVRGNLQVAGSRRWGSVLVASEDGRVEAITSAILVGGNATFRHGILPGLTVEDLVGAVGRKDPLTASLGKDFLEPSLEVWSPNIAKCRGPFWLRKPFFASCATKVDLLPPMVGAPLGLPANMNCLFFTAATIAEVPFLNGVFGEFMALHSDAWLFGDETVPALVKVPTGPLESMARSWGARYQQARFQPGLESRLTDLVAVAGLATTDTPRKMMTEIYWDLFRQFAWVLFPMDPPVAIPAMEKLDEARAKVELLRRHFGYRDLSDICHELQRYLNPSERTPSNECPGVLVYSAGDMSIGNLSEDTSAAVGMYVAGGNFSCDCRRLVGSVVSFRGQIRCRELWYYPGFTRASLALPGPVPVGNRDALQQVTLMKYGKNLNPRPEALSVGVGKAILNSEWVER